MARILVTGANGHIGSNTVRCLLCNGHEVIPFVRPNADLRGLDHLGLSHVVGDVKDLNSVRSAVKNCNVVVHMAANYQIWSKDPEEIIQPALMGANNVFMAAKEANIERIVYTSSVASVGYSDSSESLRTEKDWHGNPRLPYISAKTQSEKEAWRLSKELNIPTIVICPAMVLGPYDYRITPSTELIMNMINGKGQTFKGGVNVVDVRDVATVHASAVDIGEPGKRYIVGGTNLEWKEIGEIINQIAGVKPKHLAFSRSISMAVAAIVEFGAKISGSKPLFTRDIAYEVVDKYAYFNTELTNSTFDLTPRSAEDTLKDCIRWLVHQDRIKSGLKDKLKDKFSPDPSWNSA